MTDEQLARLFSEALVSEIKAEMGRRDLSTRAVARQIDANSQYLSQRLDGGSPRTGVRVPLNAVDLAAISEVLGVSLSELIRRAEAVASRRGSAIDTSNLELVANDSIDEHPDYDDADYEHP